MKITKSIIFYFISSLVSFLLSFIYMRIILGAKPEYTSDFMLLFDWLYQYVFIWVALVIGSINALLFIVIDVFYLKKILKNTTSSVFMRFFIIVLLTLVVGTTHYVLEKVFNVI